ncbi:PQQ-dependent sugar dehydrogenase [Agromyces archimandritae]|uniref:PQQ-dependent sugar dehydrogenase n=1 Tax=Agromyces archimandritae TaxID=2781962 RepID=A0A975FNN3_9MICO|nr:PQQ-dependent sugar dehydrogenase [Agromyces archimandritae]QTX05515.1 PQQ-dependent sugar dehydrogenase [Agromyces archimandritae]
MNRRAGGIAIGLAAVLLAACTAPPPSTGPSTARTSPPAASAPPTTPPEVQPAGDVEALASGLQAPWSIATTQDGGVLVSERDTARIVEIGEGGAVREVAVVPGVVHGGEGGLLGLAVREAGDGRGRMLYAYSTGEGGNRIQRMDLAGGPGGYTLGEPETILDGIPAAATHNGGRLAFGPDGMLYATTGDATLRGPARDPASLAGKILRMMPDGGVPDDSATGTIVHSMGHRNPQGLAWDTAGRLWAAEFGQNTWDELNLIEGGGDYGWPDAEGAAGLAGTIDPVAQWPTSEASPSGLAAAGDTLFLAALRGERLIAVYPPREGVRDAAESVDWFAGEFGRLREAHLAPDGSLWMLTNNTDGRGTPGGDDDRLLRVRLAPLAEG